MCALAFACICTAQTQAQAQGQNGSAAFELPQKASYGTELTIEPMNKTVKKSGKNIVITAKGEGETYIISGYFDGQIITRTKNTILKLNGAYLENTSGKPAVFADAKVEISSANGTVNCIASRGKSTEKPGALHCRKNLVLGGSGTLYISGGVYHGIKCDDAKIKGSGVLFARGTASGAALNCQTLTVEKDKSFTAHFVDSKNGIKADEAITVNSGTFYITGTETALKTNKKKDEPKVKHSITLNGGTFYVSGNKKLHSTDDGAFTASGAKILEE